nr:oxidoreductase [Cronobacter turicensis]
MLHLSVVVIYFIDFKGYLQKGIIWFVFYTSFLISFIIF